MHRFERNNRILDQVRSVRLGVLIPVISNMGVFVEQILEVEARVSFGNVDEAAVF